MKGATGTLPPCKRGRRGRRAEGDGHRTRAARRALSSVASVANRRPPVSACQPRRGPEPRLPRGRLEPASFAGARGGRTGRAPAWPFGGSAAAYRDGPPSERARAEPTLQGERRAAPSGLARPDTCRPGSEQASDGAAEGARRESPPGPAASAGCCRSALAGDPGGVGGARLRGRAGDPQVLVRHLGAALREADRRLDLPAAGGRQPGAGPALPAGRLPGHARPFPPPGVLGRGRGRARRLHHHRQPDPGRQRHLRLRRQEPPRRAAQPPADRPDRHAERSLLSAVVGGAALPSGLPPLGHGGVSAAAQDGEEVRGAAGRPENRRMQEVLHRSA